MTTRIDLYKRLPEIYRIRDQEQQPAGQLEAYVGLIDEVHSAIRDDIASLGRDAFIESCADWVIPYIADLLGSSHLSGDAWTLRADVARTINHRRRKGTLGAIESLAYALSGWAAHTVEIRERLLWNQHINHLRPDAGGVPPLSLSNFLSDARRGGTVNLRDPALLSLINTPFDPFAHVADVKPAAGWRGLHNLPNLGIFLWRLRAYTVARVKPLSSQFVIPPALVPASAAEANFAVRLELHPQSEPMVLFNTHRFQADDEPANISSPDAVPGPMPYARLSADTPAGRPEHYVEIAPYPDGTVPPRMNRLGLSLQIPQTLFSATTPWRFRGANLCAWETGLQPALRAHEIAIDPDRGRVVFGAMGATQVAEADKLVAGLFVSATHGFQGPVGAEPIPRETTPASWLEVAPIVVSVDPLNTPANTLQAALANLQNRAQPLIIEIRDSQVHDLDLSLIAGTTNTEFGLHTLRLNRSLWIRAVDGERPVIRLKKPLAFRPHDVLGANAPAVMDSLMVRLEGIYLTRDKTSFPANTPLIARAALNQLHIQDCTLDPGGYVALNGVRTAIHQSMRLDNSNGFFAPNEILAFDQSPEIVLENSICGPLAIDDDYSVNVINSIIDAGGTLETTTPALAIGAATGNAELTWGPSLTVDGLTCFGRMRVTSASGKGGIWVHALQVLDNQSGCIRHSWFADADNRLPSNYACLHESQADLYFVAETFGRPGYAQITRDSDVRILEQGPNDDEMGAFGFQLNSHKWKNIQIRFREYMPVGVRPVLVAVT
ncbi:MAG: hypothetical protein ACREO1_10615 [Arenimonas sp.]